MLKYRKIRTLGVTLRATNEEDLPTLLEWRNSDVYRLYCSGYNGPTDMEGFRKERDSEWRMGKRVEERMILDKEGRRIGVIFAYDRARRDGRLLITIFLAEPMRSRGLGVAAFYIYCMELFTKFQLYKIYVDVWEYNRHAIRPLERFGWIQEGRFRGHRLDDGKRYDLLRFAMYRNMLFDEE